MITTALQPEKDVYLSSFRRSEDELAQGPPSLRRLREEAIARFDELGFPNARTEDWRFTSVTPLLRVPFRPATPGSAGLSVDHLQHIPGMDAPCRLVFVNGFHAPSLSSLPTLPSGVLAGSLAQVLESAPETVEAHLARQAGSEEHAFAALNTAFFRDGAVVFLPRGVVLDEPVHLVFLSTAPTEATVSYPRNLIVAGAGSRLTVAETYAGLSGGVYFTNAVTEVLAEEGAVVDHYKVQQEGAAAFHVAVTRLEQHQGSTFSSTFLGFGGALVRNEVRVVLAAEGCECTLNGLYQAAGRQHMDNHTVIDHARAHCASHELYKGILDGRAHGVFNGKIFVRQDAQKTDAKQTNQTLLLSDDATINTKPQLEIYADDVKCTHGATVGQLDEEATFYLRSRGIGRDEARSLLTFAFANDVLSRVQIDSIRHRLEQDLLKSGHLPEADQIPERS